ncbi:hypothetical protein [Leuconostoc mesenteroides]|uniref:hypothetical protein n=1 Tax=Leuconostoc mesenteroides TaxID=1245 RepID=UPI00107FC313|nr:hypothetical protein [Leuconostoc mesenteroides]TGD33803.1 hypothetical protein EIA53_09370 [Leuconostoc mesenteroides]
MKNFFARTLLIIIGIVFGFVVDIFLLSFSSKNDWLGFLGNILGSGLGVLGSFGVALFTINAESGRREQKKNKIYFVEIYTKVVRIAEEGENFFNDETIEDIIFAKQFFVNYKESVFGNEMIEELTTLIGVLPRQRFLIQMVGGLIGHKVEFDYKVSRLINENDVQIFKDLTEECYHYISDVRVALHSINKKNQITKDLIFMD